MRKVISTIVVTAFVSSMLVNTAFAGNHHLEVLNPLWLPVAIPSTMAATVAAVAQPSVVYEQRVYPEPRQTVVYDEPRHYRNAHYYEHGPVEHYDGDSYSSYEEPRYHEYR